jgi:hypothetical protein
MGRGPFVLHGENHCTEVLNHTLSQHANLPETCIHHLLSPTITQKNNIQRDGKTFFCFVGYTHKHYFLNCAVQLGIFRKCGPFILLLACCWHGRLRSTVVLHIWEGEAHGGRPDTTTPRCKRAIASGGTTFLDGPISVNLP